MHALVIGGGMAGPVTAMALRKAGIDATVHEAYERSADGVGAFLTLAVNGMAALRTLDLHTGVRALGFDTPRMTMSMGNGKRVLDVGFGTPLSDGTHNQTITRSALYGFLRDEAVRRGVPVEYGKRLVSAESSGDGVVATFADGSTAHGDLLIGADGLRSTTRRIIDPAAPAPRYVPLLNTGGYAKGVEVDGEPGVMNMMFGRQCFFCYVVRPGGEVWWFANPRQPKELPAAELAAVTPAQWRSRLTGLFAADRSPAVALIEATEEVFSGWNTYDFPTVPTWHRDRKIIIGDAAHATSPASGQGASMAFEDAVTLAKCLRDLPDVPAAFAAYEGLRRTRVERVVAQGKRNGDGKSLGPVAQKILPLIMRLARPDERKLSWLHDHRIDWDARITGPGVMLDGRR
jgi:2-polyprenyl-6-methoxyphenol hydroxylase-like FAD-dependent oxidoreductase